MLSATRRSVIQAAGLLVLAVVSIGCARLRGATAQPPRPTPRAHGSTSEGARSATALSSWRGPGVPPGRRNHRPRALGGDNGSERDGQDRHGVPQYR